MTKPKPISPTFDLVIEKFKEAMSADGLIDNDLCDRLIKTLTSDAAVTPERIADALFPSEKEGDEP